MADLSKVEAESGVTCSPHKFHELIKYSLHHLPSVFPDVFMDSQILEGDGESVGSLRQWRYILPGTTDEQIVKERIIKHDDENMLLAFCIEEGDIHNHYQHFNVTVQVFPKGGGSMVKWIVEFAKHQDETPDPHHFLQMFRMLSEKVGEHV